MKNREEVQDEEEVQGKGERSRQELPHLGSGGRGGGKGSPNKICSKLLVVANYLRQVLEIERHFDLGLGTWTPTTSIHAGGVVSPSLRDILPKRWNRPLGITLPLAR